MSVAPQLLQAIVRVDGDALVMHAGDKPYVVTSAGQVDLSTRGLNLEAINDIVNQLLPVELQNALEEFGAVQYEVPPNPEFPGEQFTVVVARGGDDVWAEIRRRRIADDDRVPDDFFDPVSADAGEQGEADAVSVAAQPAPKRAPEPVELDEAHEPQTPPPAHASRADDDAYEISSTPEADDDL